MDFAEIDHHKSVAEQWKYRNTVENGETGGERYKKVMKRERTERWKKK